MKLKEGWYLPRMTKMWRGKDLNPELLTLLLRASHWSPQLGVRVRGVYQSADEKVHR